MESVGRDHTPDAGSDVVRSPARGPAMIGFRDRDAAGFDIRVTAMPAVSVAIAFGPEDLVVDARSGRRTLSGFVSWFGNGTMHVRSRHAECLEVRLSPAAAYSILGSPPTDFKAIIDVDELWGHRAQRLREQLAAAENWEQRFVLMRSFLVGAGEPRWSPDPEVMACWDRLIARRGQVNVGELADFCGWSRKRLWARFESQVGIGPKQAAMLVRLRHAIDGLVAGRPAAEVAADCGYADQSHLCRDVAIFTDVTPGEIAREPLSLIARRRHQAWGTFVQYPD